MSRLRQLDGLRGLAAVGVLIFHFGYRAPQFFPEVGGSVPWMILGRQGVLLFFVISGFVITMSLERSSLRGFVASRVSRLFPVYWASVLITFVVTVLLLPSQAVSPLVAVANLSMIQEYFGVPDVAGVYWTLAIELAFYAQAAVLHFTGMLRGKRLPVTLLAWLGVAMAVTVAVHSVPGADASLLGANMLRAFAYLPFFIAGIAVLELYRKRNHRSMAFVLLAAAVCMLIEHKVADEISTFGIVYALVVLVVVKWWSVGLDSKPLQFLGAISYALYVLHELLGYAVIIGLMRLGVNRLVASVAAVAVAVLLAWLVTRLVDDPLRAPLRKLLSRRPTPERQQKPTHRHRAVQLRQPAAVNPSASAAGPLEASERRTLV